MFTQYIADRNAGTLDVHNPATFDIHQARCRQVRAAWTELQARSNTLVLAWQELRRIESLQPPVVAASTAALNHLINQYQGAARGAIINANQMSNFMAHPPVPQDAQGRERMPAAWVIGDRHEIRYKDALGADYTNNDLGILPIPPGVNERWEPQKNLSGGLSNGWVWVRLDDNDRILDVCRAVFC